MYRPLTAAALTVTLTLSAANESAWAQEKPKSRGEVSVELIKLTEQMALGDKKTRDAATERLLKIGDDAFGTVRDLLSLAEQRNDADLRQRAGLVHDKIMEKRQSERAANEKRLRERLAKDTALGIDYFVGRMIRDRKKLTDDDWDILNQVEEKLKKVGRTTPTKKDRQGVDRGIILEWLYCRNFEKVRVSAFGDKTRGLTRTCIAADSIKSAGIGSCMVVCKDSLDTTSGPMDSIALFGKEAKLGSSVAGHSVIVSEGDFECDWLCSDTVVIAAGNVRIPLGTRVLVIAKGTVEIKSPMLCTVRAGATEIFDNVGFFTPTLVGLEVETINRSLVVRNLGKKSTFANAGIKTGDAILAIAGTKVVSEGQFTTLLREAVLAKGADFLTKRQDTEMKLRVKFESD